ncbi:signal transduction histidine kinase [Microcella putealis]|uniref:histidine kinase n=1 Tax=Microcella putealis TaxID=337005 RepID=A0A4Q7LP72_9MICO|nr:ATP-binding protein [Microcella putealis]RZS56191.1 signal transduction histidine kinase [Microcella putealis]TQM23378.1 signal transduction histidine kinase [Microcella putealis]
MGFTSMVWSASPAVRRSVIAILLFAAGLVSFYSVELRPAGAAIAAWWPAAGLGVAAVLASRGTRIAAALGVLIVAMAANVLGGREWGLTIGYGIANAVEVWVVAWVLTRGTSAARLDGVRDIARFLVACAAGATVIGVIGAVTAFTVAGQPLEVAFFSLVASHFSALVVVLPLFLLSPRTHHGRVSVVEVVVQVITLIALTWFVFTPGNELPTSYLPLAAVLWAAFRLPTVVVATELLVLATAATILTVLGGGPFAPFIASGERTTVLLLQGFLIVHALAALFVSGARNDWGRALVRVEAQEELLRDGIVNADSGIVIAELTDQSRLVIRGINQVALDAFGLTKAPVAWFTEGILLAPSQPVLGNRELDALLRKQQPGEVELQRGNRRFDASVSVRALGRGSAIVTVVISDVTRRQEREDAAVQSLARLHDLNRQKDDFIAAVSHELRTPVTAIMGFSEQLVDEPLSHEALQAATVIDRNARRLADVIEDVLELSRLTGSTSISRTPVAVDLRDLVEQAAEDARGLFPQRAIDIVVTLPTEPVVARVIRQDVQRVIANLLSNAVKFSPLSGHVRVVLTGNDTSAELTITDDGPGIPADQLPLVWERFYRVQDESHRDAPGTGLGLPIVRALVEERLGGDIELLPGPHRRGTVARLTVPLGAGEQAVSAP